MIRSEEFKPWRIFLVVGIAGAVATAIVVYAMITGARLGLTHTPYIETVRAARLEATLAHLWMEEILSGDRHESVEGVWEQFETAGRHVRVLLHGGETVVGRVEPVKDPELRHLGLEVSRRLERVRELAERRLGRPTESSPGSDIDQVFDREFADFSNDCMALEDRLGRLALRDRDRLALTLWVLIGVCLLSTLAAMVWGFRTEKDRVGDWHELEATHAERRESEASLKSIFRAAPIGIGVVVDRVIVSVNDRFCEMLGYSEDELLSQSARMVYVSDEEYERVGREKYAQISALGTGTVETQFLRKDGAVIDVLLSSTPLDIENPAAGVTFTALDITDRKRAEVELMLKNRVFDVALTANCTSDRDGEFTQVNDAFLNAWGYETKAEVIGRPVSAFMRFRHEAKEILDALNEKGSWEGEFTALRADSTTFDAYGMATAIKDESGVLVGYQSTVLDISETKRSRAALAESEMRFAQLFREAPLPYQSLNPQGRLLDVNETWLKVLGYDLSEVVGRPFVDFLAPPAKAGFTTQFKKFIEVGENRGSELDVLRRDGTMLTMAFTGRVAMDAAGRARRTHCILRDVTEEREAKRRLEEQERYYRSLMHSLHEDILVIDREYRITDVNKAALATIGQSRDEVVGRFCYEVSHGYDVLCAEKGKQCVLAEVFATGEKRSFRHVHRSASGGEVDVDIRLSPLRDETGQVTRVVEAGRDITEMETTRTMLADSESRYRELVEKAKFAILIDDEDGGFRYFNARFPELFGFSREEMEGRKIQSLVHPDDVDRVMDLHRRRTAGHEVPSRYDFRGVRKDRTTIYLEAEAVPIEENGQTVGSRSYFRDVTWERGLEQQLVRAQKLEAMGQLAGGIAHDFNNLLMAISGSADLLAMQLPEIVRDSQELTTIRNTVQRGAELTRRLLAIARQQVLQMEVLDLDQMVVSELKILRRVISENIEIAYCSSGDLPAVRADRVQLAQVLMNLVVNARDAMPDGGTITIEIRLAEWPLVDRVSSRKDDGPCLCLAVADTGDGMDAETQSRVFDPFFSTKTPEQGTGLGLATVYGIVHQHKGVVVVTSALGKGSRFEVCFPVVEEMPGENGEEGPVEVVGGDEKILVVEDDPAVRKAFAEILKGLGYRVLETRDGIEALAVLERENGIDLVLSDVVMPRMGGRELLQKAENLPSRPAFLFSSGYTDEALREMLEVTERTSFIAKPFTTAKLGLAVRDALGARSE